MDIPTIRAWPREERRTRSCRRLRKHGLVPAVLYGRREPNVLLTVQGRELAKLLSGHGSVLRVEWNGHGTPTQLKEVQYDPLGDEIIHADFVRISLTETVRVAVPVETHGEAAGVKEGGSLEVILHEIEVECLPTNIPQSIRADVSELKAGEDLRVRDLLLPDGVQALQEPDAVAVLVAMPTETAEEEGPEEEVAAEPEVIGRASAQQEAEEGEDAGGR